MFHNCLRRCATSECWRNAAMKRQKPLLELVTGDTPSAGHSRLAAALLSVPPDSSKRLAAGALQAGVLDCRNSLLLALLFFCLWRCSCGPPADSLLQSAD